MAPKIKEEATTPAFEPLGLPPNMSGQDQSKFDSSFDTAYGEEGPYFEPTPVFPGTTAAEFFYSDAGYPSKESSKELGFSPVLGAVLSGNAAIPSPPPDLSQWSGLFEHSPDRRQMAIEKERRIILEKCSSLAALNDDRDLKSDFKKELPPVVIADPNDRAAVRRARNTEAARRSRAKKNERITELERMVRDLQIENSVLMAENVLLRRHLQIPPSAAPVSVKQEYDSDA